MHQVSHGRHERDVAQFTSHKVFIPTLVVPAPMPYPRTAHSVLSPLSRYSKLSTTAFLSFLTSSPSLYTNHRLVSLTWTKALGSPLSHESIQFVVEDTQTGIRSRLVTDRHVDGGDSVVVGFDWTSCCEPSQHHALPLPLLSLTFEDAPNIAEFAKVLVDITNRKPEYSLLREMCWWYAEAIFEVTHSKYGGKIKTWDFAHLRYSFVVRTNVIKREKLVRHAEEFRRLNVTEMEY